MEISAKNQIKGKITSVIHGTKLFSSSCRANRR